MYTRSRYKSYFYSIFNLKGSTQSDCSLFFKEVIQHLSNLGRKFMFGDNGSVLNSPSMFSTSSRNSLPSSSCLFIYQVNDL
jgi:hypothetical protein